MRSSYDGKRDTAGVDRRIGALASRQHGVFSREQAIGLDISEGEIRWRVHVGRWERVFPKVFRLAGTHPTWSQRAMAACLHWGGTLSHRAAAKQRAIGRLTQARVEVSVNRKRNRKRAEWVTIHWTTEPIPAEDVTVIEGIPVTKPARTLLDLASTESERFVARCLDEALRRRLVSLPFLERWLADPSRERHPGRRVLGRLIDERATIGVTGSPLEERVLRLLRDAGLPLPMLQYVVEGRSGFVARLDMAYPERRMAIEVDGFRYHDTRQGFDDERARGNELKAMGWDVLRITSKHLERYPDEVAEWVRRALAGSRDQASSNPSGNASSRRTKRLGT